MLRKLINYYLPIWDFLYLLQLEEYDISRYWKQAVPRLFKRNFEVRDRLQYTGRAKATIVLVFVLLGLFVAAFVPFVRVYTLPFLLILIPVMLPALVALASWMVGIPVSIVRKRRLQQAHRMFLSEYPNTKVVAVTGSFGKTTAKYLLQHVLQYDYKTTIIPDNINTSLGIANFLLAGNVPLNTEILIVEMGAYTQGDIAEAASVVTPDFAIVTIYGDQHLERFGSFSNLVKGKSEIFAAAKTRGYLTTDALAIAKEHGVGTGKLTTVTVPAAEKSTPFLVAKLAEDLGVSHASIHKSLATFTPPDRRNNVFVRDGVTIIDNSYNISPMVAEAMVREGAKLAASHEKKLVVLTAGIGEQAPHEKEVNEAFAEVLNQYADRVILCPSSYAAFIEPMLSITHQATALALDVTEQPSRWIDAEQEVLLWLTDHTDLAYF